MIILIYFFFGLGNDVNIKNYTKNNNIYFYSILLLNNMNKKTESVSFAV